MIIQCPACRSLVEVREASAGPQGAGLRCVACSAMAWLPWMNAGAVAPEHADHPAHIEDSPPGALPPSLPPAPETAAGPAPGPLDAQAQQGWRAALDGLASPPPSGASIHEPFVALLARWQDEAAHRALAQRAVAAGELPALGLHYRALLACRPEDAMAKQAQQHILTLAMAQLSPLGAAARETPRQGAGWLWASALLACALLALVGLWLWFGLAPAGE